LHTCTFFNQGGRRRQRSLTQPLSLLDCAKLLDTRTRQVSSAHWRHAGQTLIAISLQSVNMKLLVYVAPLSACKEQIDLLPPQYFAFGPTLVLVTEIVASMLCLKSLGVLVSVVLSPKGPRTWQAQQCLQYWHQC